MVRTWASAATPGGWPWGLLASSGTNSSPIPSILPAAHLQAAPPLRPGCPGLPHAWWDPLNGERRKGQRVWRGGCPRGADEAGLPCYKHSSQVDTVSEQGEDDEVDGGPHARANASLRADAVVHHLVPVLARQDLHESKPAGRSPATLVTLTPSCHPDTLHQPHQRAQGSLEGEAMGLC